MRCPYCSENVIGAEKVIMITGEGPAHLACHERREVSERVFFRHKVAYVSDGAAKRIERTGINRNELSSAIVRERSWVVLVFAVAIKACSR